jgi:hypothetical protein
MLIEKIEQGLTREKNKKRESHYPSDITACMRQLFFKWIEEPPSNPISPGGYLKMEMGNAIHALVPMWLEKAGLEIVSEISVSKSFPSLQYPISGRLDNLYIIPGTEDELGLLEVKTTYGTGVKTIQQKGKPKPEHLIQVQIYMWLEPKIKEGHIVYIGRDNGYRTEFKVTLEGFDAEVVLERLNLLEKRIKHKKLPARDFKVAIKNGSIKNKFQKDKKEYKTDWQCSYCQWLDMCWNSFLETVASDKQYLGEEEVK